MRSWRETGGGEACTKSRREGRQKKAASDFVQPRDPVEQIVGGGNGPNPWGLNLWLQERTEGCAQAIRGGKEGGWAMRSRG